MRGVIGVRGVRGVREGRGPRGAAQVLLARLARSRISLFMVFLIVPRPVVSKLASRSTRLPGEARACCPYSYICPYNLTVK